MKKFVTILLLLCSVVAMGQTSFQELKRKAEAGDALAQNDLAIRYENGDGVSKNLIEAVKWYRKSAEQGNKYGQYNLGVCYEEGKGIPRDCCKALEWYMKSANQGYVDAQFQLGFLYDGAEGVAEDNFEAEKWYKMAAAHGHKYAYYSLGLRYQYGWFGVKKDLYKAKAYFMGAVANGAIEAIDAIAEIEQELGQPKSGGVKGGSNASKGERVPELHPIYCVVCGGNGRCTSCWGERFPYEDKSIPCGACKGTALCGVCKGAGITGYDRY